MASRRKKQHLPAPHRGRVRRMVPSPTRWKEAPAWLPLPDAIDAVARRVDVADDASERFTVRTPHNGESYHTSLSAREVVVPTGSHPSAARIRSHEMGHVRWTPRNVPNPASPIERTALQVAEDVRIWERLNIVGIKHAVKPADDHRLVDMHISKLYNNGDRVAFASAIVSMYGMCSNDTFGNALNTIDAHAAKCSQSAKEQAAAGDDDVASTYKEYARNFTRCKAAIKRCLAGVDRLRSSRRTSVPTFNETKRLTKLFTRVFNSIVSDERDTTAADLIGDRMVVDDAEPDQKWATIRDRDNPPALTIPTVVFNGRKHIAREEGTIPRNMARYCADGRVFTRSYRKPVPSPSILLDVSGSMSVTREWVAKAMAMFPYATIAQYSGYGDYGHLDILMEDGRRCALTDIPPSLGGNAIDGPALRWLATKNGPRVWVSDGQATAPSNYGGGEALCGPALMAEIADICAAADITRVPDLGNVLPIIRSALGLTGRTASRMTPGMRIGV